MWTIFFVNKLACPNKHKQFVRWLPGWGGVLPTGWPVSGCPAGRIGDRGDQGIIHVPNVYVPFLAPSHAVSSSAFSLCDTLQHFTTLNDTSALCVERHKVVIQRHTVLYRVGGFKKAWRVVFRRSASTPFRHLFWVQFAVTLTIDL